MKVLKDGFLLFSSSKSKGLTTIKLKKYDKELKLLAEYQTEYEFKTAMSPSLEIPEDESYFLIVQNHTFKSTIAHMTWLDKDLNELSSVGGEFEELTQAKADRLASKDNYVVSYYPEMYGAFNGIESYLASDVLYEFRYTDKSMGEDGPVFIKFSLKEKAGVGNYKRNWLTKMDVKPKDVVGSEIFGASDGKVFLFISTKDTRKIYEVDDASGEIINTVELNSKLDDDLSGMGLKVSNDGRLCYLGVKEEGFTIATVKRGAIGNIVKLGGVDYISMYTEANKKTTGMKKDQTSVSSCSITFKESGKCFVTVPVYGVTKLSQTPYRILGFDMMMFDENGDFVNRGFITTNNDGMLKTGGSAELAGMYTYDFMFAEEEGEIAVCFKILSSSKKGKYDMYTYKGEFKELMPAKLTKKEQNNTDYYRPKTTETAYYYQRGSKKEPTTFKIVPLK